MSYTVKFCMEMSDNYGEFVKVFTVVLPKYLTSPGLVLWNPLFSLTDLQGFI